MCSKQKSTEQRAAGPVPGIGLFMQANERTGAEMSKASQATDRIV